MHLFVKQVQIITAILILLLIFSCKNRHRGNQNGESEQSKQKVNTKVTGTINFLAEDVVLQLVNDIASGFRLQYPNVIVNSVVSDSDPAMQSLDNGTANVAFVSTPSDLINKSVYTVKPFARDILVLILNFNNKLLQTLVIYGIPKKALTDILEMKITMWKNVSKRIEDNEPLKMYIPSKKSGSIEYIARFTGLTKEKIKTDDVILEKDVPANVTAMPLAIGFCSHTLAYDFSTNVRKNGLYIVGVDINNNNVLDNEELIYDDLDILRQAVLNNSAPKELVRTFSLCYRNDSPHRDLIELFAEYIQKNGNTYIEKYKFYPSQNISIHNNKKN